MWKEVFKAGIQRDSNGNERLWTSEDLDTIIKKYTSQTEHEAPIVIGHPVNNSPAYGWVETLKRDGDVLLAKFKQTDPQFEELVNTGRYKKVSIALYPDMNLRHIGYLGAIPPAIKGLKDANFNDDTDITYIETEFNETNINQKSDKKPTANNYNSIFNFKGGNMPDIQLMFNEFIKWLGTTFNEKPIVFNEEIASQAAAEWENIKTKYSPKEEQRQEPILHNEPETDAFKQIKAKVKELEMQNNELQFNEYYNTLLRAGKLVPAQKDIVKQALQVAQAGFVFSENTDIKPEQIVKKLIESFPKQIDFNEFATNDKANIEGTNILLEVIDEHNKGVR
jgi:hypothetical protein